MPSFKSIPITLGKLPNGPPQHFRAPKSPVQIGLKEFSIACGVSYNTIFRSCPYNFFP